MALKRLAVRISSQTADVQRGLSAVRQGFSRLGREALQTGADTTVAGERLDEVGDEAAGAASKLYLMSDATDEVGDEMLSTVPRAAGASGAVTTFGFSSEGASVGVTSLSASLTGFLIPALVALSTLLAPITAILGTAVAGLGSLAGAFGLVIGSGVIAGFERLKATLQESLGLIEAQLTGFGQRAIPVLDSILSQLPALVSDILSAFGGTGTFLDALSSGFNTIRQVAPAVVRTIRELAVDALPVLRDVIGYLIANGPSIFRELVSTTRELAPQIMDFVDAVIEAAPAILEFGTFVFEVVVPALSDLIRLLRPGIAFIASFRREFALVNELLGDTPAALSGVLTPLKLILAAAIRVQEALADLVETATGVSIPGVGNLIQGGASMQSNISTQSIQRSAQEIRLSGELEFDDSGRLVAKIDERYQSNSEAERRNATNRGFARRNFSN